MELKRKSEKVEDLILYQKVYDMIKYGYTALRQFPKSEKYAMGSDIKKCMHIIMEKVIEAQKKYYKKTTLQELDVNIAKLKMYLRLSNELGFLPHKQYAIWSKMVVEIGKITGGWIKSVKK